MSSNVGKKNIAHKGSGHGAVAPAAMSLVTPPAPPAPAPFPYTARVANARDTVSKLTVPDKEVLVEGSTIPLDPPANQPAQSGGGDTITHATKNVAVMTTGAMGLTVGGKRVCATGDIAALNVLTKQSKVAQMQLPLLEAGDFDTASKSNAAAAEANRIYRRAHPPRKANQCAGGHPVDLGTGYVVDDAVDPTLPGFIPLVWSRSYSSAASARRGALGKGGWTHSFEQWVEVTEEGFRLHDEEGLPVEFGPIAENGISFHRGHRLELRQSGSTIEIRSLADRLIRTFSPLPSGKLALRAIRDARGHRIQLEYEGEALARIVDSVKREIRLTNNDKGCVTRVEVWASEPGSGRPATLQTWFDYGYHVEGELAYHTNALGHTERWEYDGLHRMVKVTLRNGVSFYYEYDPELGHCVHTWGDGGLHDVHIEIDFEKGVTCTHGTNRARRYLWKNGIVYREETFDGAWATERIYDEDEILVALRNGAGEETSFKHDARGNLIEETDAAGNVSTWDIEDDLPVRYIGPTGLETRYGHDRYGALVWFSLPTGLSYNVERDREGRLCALVGEEGVRFRLGYDEHSNGVTESSGRGATTSYRHDALGRPVEQTDALGRTRSVRYDRLGQTLEVVRPDGTRVCATYDPLGELASATDALGHVTRLEHAGTGHLAKLVQADGQIYRFIYDTDERLIRILNPRLEEYEFEYDLADQIVAERTFDKRLITFKYDRAGRLVRVNYPEGEWREYRYDTLGHILEDRGSDVQIAFVRDKLGRVEIAVSQDACAKVTTEFERDRFGRLTADIQNGRAVRYEYDEQSRRCARILPDGERTEYHYDRDGTFTGATHEGKRVTILRDVLGREQARKSEHWEVDIQYDAMDRVLSQKVVMHASGPAGSKVVAERRYGYDRKGRVTWIDSLCGGLTAYKYDAVDQLVEACRGGTPEIFEYDPAGSLINMLSNLGDMGVKPMWSLASGNQLKATDRAKFVNDGRGRRIQRIECVGGKDPRETPPRGEKMHTFYGWDTKDRLREVILADGTRVRFTYDAFGRRVSKEMLPPSTGREALLGGSPVASSGRKTPVRKTVEFLWDGDVLCEERDFSKEERAQKRVHVHEPGTFVPMLQVEQGEVFGVINDHLGTPKELVDAAGHIAWRAEHAAWGVVLDRRTESAIGAACSPFGALGRYLDRETGLYYTRFRYFDADTGRWLSPDPLGAFGGDNAFGLNVSPSLGVDPWGLVDARSRGYPHGFKSYGEWNQFGQATRAGLSSAGYSGTAPIMQGSAVSGVSHDTGVAFDVGRHSDFDVALAGAAIYAKAVELGLAKGGRTGPLSDDDIQAMGLAELRAKMQRLAKGRKVNFMIFESEEAAVVKSKASMAFMGKKC